MFFMRRRNCEEFRSDNRPYRLRVLSFTGSVATLSERIVSGRMTAAEQRWRCRPGLMLPWLGWFAGTRSRRQECQALGTVPMTQPNSETIRTPRPSAYSGLSASRMASANRSCPACCTAGHDGPAATSARTAKSRSGNSLMTCAAPRPANRPAPSAPGPAVAGAVWQFALLGAAGHGAVRAAAGVSIRSVSNLGMLGQVGPAADAWPVARAGRTRLAGRRLTGGANCAAARAGGLMA